MDWNFLIRNKESLTVTTDSRRVTPGCVFVALRGEHFDGNDFVAQAERDGAAYVIKGENALRDLQDLARNFLPPYSLRASASIIRRATSTTRWVCPSPYYNARAHTRWLSSRWEPPIRAIYANWSR